MKDYLDKSCYKKNFNEGQKNWEEILTGVTFISQKYYIPNILIVYLFFCLNVLFVTIHL